MGFLNLVALAWVFATTEAGALWLQDAGSAGAVAMVDRRSTNKWKWPWQKKKADKKRNSRATALEPVSMSSSGGAEGSQDDVYPARPQLQAVIQDHVEVEEEAEGPGVDDDTEQRAEPQLEAGDDNEATQQKLTPVALKYQSNGVAQSFPTTPMAAPVFRSNSTSGAWPRLGAGLNPAALAALLAPRKLLPTTSMAAPAFRSNSTSGAWLQQKPGLGAGLNPAALAAMFAPRSNGTGWRWPWLNPSKGTGNSSGQHVPVVATVPPNVAALAWAALRPRPVPPPTVLPKRPPLNIASLIGRDNNVTWPLYPSGKVPGHIPEIGSLLAAKIEKPLINKMCKIGHTTGDIDLVREPSLKPFLVDPDDPHRTDAAVVIAPGGANLFLAWEREGTTIAKWLNSIGISAFVLKYRVPGGTNTDGSLMDAQRAMSMVRSRAVELGLNRSRIGFMGFSAAGYLSDRLSSSIKRMYKKIDDEDEAHYWPDFQMVVYGGGPKKIVGHRPPPTLVVHAQDDPCGNVRGGTAYCEAVRRDSGQICERLLYPNGGHGYGTCAVYTNSWSGITVCDWIHKAESFIRTHMLGSPVNSI